MIGSNLEKAVSRLDGYLSGIAACNGHIRDYSAFAFVVDTQGNDKSIEEVIRAYFHWLPNLKFSEAKILERGFRDLEESIGPLLVRDGSHSQIDLGDLRKYLSFRTMEQMSLCIGERVPQQIVRLVAASESDQSQSVFFGIRMQSHVVVMQFNDDREFLPKTGTEVVNSP